MFGHCCMRFRRTFDVVKTWKDSQTYGRHENKLKDLQIASTENSESCWANPTGSECLTKECVKSLLKVFFQPLRAGCRFVTSAKAAPNYTQPPTSGQLWNRIVQLGFIKAHLFWEIPRNPSLCPETQVNCNLDILGPKRGYSWPGGKELAMIHPPSNHNGQVQSCCTDSQWWRVVSLREPPT